MIKVSSHVSAFHLGFFCIGKNHLHLLANLAVLRKAPGTEKQGDAAPCVRWGGGNHVEGWCWDSIWTETVLCKLGAGGIVLGAGKGSEWKKHKSDSLLLLECVASSCLLLNPEWVS